MVDEMQMGEGRLRVSETDDIETIRLKRQLKLLSNGTGVVNDHNQWLGIFSGHGYPIYASSIVNRTTQKHSGYRYLFV